MGLAKGDPSNKTSTVSPATADVLAKLIAMETPAAFSEASIMLSEAAVALIDGFPGAVVSTEKALEVTCVAALPAASATSAVIV